MQRDVAKALWLSLLTCVLVGACNSERRSEDPAERQRSDSSAATRLSPQPSEGATAPGAGASETGQGSTFAATDDGSPAVLDDDEVVDDGPDQAGAGEVVFIHPGDFHGTLVSRPNLRMGSSGALEGGLARVYTLVQQIRRANPQNTFYVHSGDTVSGSAEATFTRGAAITQVVNRFGIDAYVPGNWEFGYGVARFLELFAGPTAQAPWGALAANAYYTGGAPFATQPPGTRLLPAYRVAEVGGVRIGLFACTTNRGPTIVSTNITQGVAFSACTGTTLNPGTPQEVVIAPEIPTLVSLLRNQEQVDVVVMISELGLAENMWNAARYDGVDIIFSSDMHEQTTQPVVVATPAGGQTLIVEEGEDGAQVGELRVNVANGRVAQWQFTAYPVTAAVPEDPEIQALVARVRSPFLAGPLFVPGQMVNPYNGARLMQPIDTVVGYTVVPLARNAFSNDYHPALVEGNAHDLLADAFRAMTGAQVGGIRGFRFSATIAPGPITYADLYSYMPIGPQIAVGEIRGAQLDRHAENAADSCMNPNIPSWLGGWMFNFSGVTFSLDPYRQQDFATLNSGRIFDYRLDTDGDGRGDRPISDTDASNYFTYASFFYAADPALLNRIALDADKVATLRVLARAPTGELVLMPPSQVTADNVVDATEVVARYLASLPNRTVTASNLPFPRIALTSPLPDTTARLGFAVIEPVYGMDRTKY